MRTTTGRYVEAAAAGLLGVLAVDAVVRAGAVDAPLAGVVSLLAGGSCLLRAARSSGDRAAWALLGAALAASAAAQIGFAYPRHAPGGTGGALALSLAPAAFVSVLLLARGRRHVRDRGARWLDGLVAALAAGAVADVLFFHPVGSYRAAGLLLVAVAAGGFAVAGSRPGRAWSLLGAGLLLAAAADRLAGHGHAADVLWPAAALLIGAAAWQPAGGIADPQRATWRMFVLPVGFAAAALGVLVYDHFAAVDTTATALATLTFAAVIGRTAVTFADNLRMVRASRREAMTDALTGLGNRRCLMVDVLTELDAGNPLALMLFDLDGFKRYNDNFGHPAGDSLLTRLGRNLAHAVRPHGRAYRLGGDEFCTLVPAAPGAAGPLVAAASAALTEHGRGFVVGASHGVVFMPSEADDLGTAMQIADRRLYGNKGRRERTTLGEQTRDVLLQVVEERQPALRDHIDEVATLAVAVGRKLGLATQELDEMGSAAELHDVGKMAIPDEILRKPGPLDPVELRFVRQHSLVGERILAASPALSAAARLVRASHERWDGSGYPDGLSGAEIPLASRVIAACDAYHAMTSARPYRIKLTSRQALGELRRCAGTHFDPVVVDAVCAEVELRWQPFDPDSALSLDPDAPTLDARVSRGANEL